MKQSYKLIIWTRSRFLVKPNAAARASRTDYLSSHSVVVVGAQFVQVQPLVYKRETEEKHREHSRG